MQRFFVAPDSAAIKENEIILRDEEQLHQMTRVLRMEVGDRVVCLDNTGMEYDCVVQELGKKNAVLKVEGKVIAKTEPTVNVTIYQALPKKMELFEWVLQKGTELGVKKFVPMITAFCQRNELPKRERLERILVEAAEQSERGIIPLLANAVEYKKAIAEDTAALKIVLHSRGTWPLLSTLMAEHKDATEVALFIGPEGGLRDDEVSLAEKSGAHIASLGPRILRTETAAIAAAALVLIPCAAHGA